MTWLGEWCVWLATALAAATMILSFAGAIRRRAELTVLGQGTTYATLAALLVVVAALVSALYSRDFSLRFVATNTSVNLPRLYTGAALWAGHQGSLLLWVLMLSACAALAVFVGRSGDRQRQAWMTGMLGAVVLYFVGMMIVGANPFVRLDWTPGDGLGMSPRLQVPAMLVQPPLLTLALVATVVPGAIALSALITRRYDVEAARALHGWSVLAWFLLSLSMLLGLWWDYTSPEWNGRWTRDFARDSILLPWLGCSALLVMQVVRGHYTVGRARLWSLMLSVAIFALALLSAYVARAGVVDSVHAYAPSPVARGFLYLAAVVVLVSVYLARTRLGDFDVAREGTPDVITRAGWRVHVVYLPLVAGMLSVVAGIAGTTFPRQTRQTLATGESAKANDPFGRTWTFTSQGISSYGELNRQLLVVSLSVSRDGRRVGMVTGEQRQLVDPSGIPIARPVAVVKVRSSPLQDIRVAFARAVDRGTAVVQIEFVPLVWWIWFGGFLTAIGGVLVMMSHQPKPDDNDVVRPRVSDDDVEAAIRRASAALISCDECGPRPEPDAVYCSNCGRKLR